MQNFLNGQLGVGLNWKNFMSSPCAVSYRKMIFTCKFYRQLQVFECSLLEWLLFQWQIDHINATYSHKKAFSDVLSGLVSKISRGKPPTNFALASLGPQPLHFKLLRGPGCWASMPTISLNGVNLIQKSELCHLLQFSKQSFCQNVFPSELSFKVKGRS